MKAVLLLLGGLAASFAAQAQVGIGTTTPAAGAALEIKSSSAGLLIPRLTAAQRTALASVPQGLLVYQADGTTASGGAQSGFWYYAGSSGWVFLNPAAAALALPYAGTASTSGTALDVTNTGTGPALSGTGSGTTSAAVQGLNNSTGASAIGVLGTTAGGYGVRGTASASGGYGVAGLATDSRGVSGFSISGVALYGNATTGLAVQGVKGSGDKGRVAQFTSTDAANDSTGVYASTAGARPALRAVSTNASAQAALRGVKTAGTDGSGVEGVVTSGGGNAAGVRGLDQSGTGAGTGVLGLTAGGYGVRGVASASGGYGVSGSATDSYGVIGQSTSGRGVYGSTGASGPGLAGVVGTNSNSSGTGVLGTTTSGNGVQGEATGSSGYGVSGTASGSNGYAFIGTATGAANGLYATASGTGRTAYFNQTGTSGTANVLEVQNASLGRTAFFNQANTSGAVAAVEIQQAAANPGLRVTSADTTTVIATTSSQNAYPLKLRGVHAAGIYFAGTPTTNNQYPYFTMTARIGPYADYNSLEWNTVLVNTHRPDMTLGNRQLHVEGDVECTGVLSAYGMAGGSGTSNVKNLNVNGTLYKSGGSFKIDHPLDPAHQYLSHSFVESPDMLNVYNGNVTLDAQGEATVELPDYFEALNRDFRYQLTSLGAFQPVFVQQEVHNRRFRIAGGQPGGRVSWQVTGIRHDKWADQNRIKNAELKEPENQGKYLHPEVFGAPAERGIFYPAPGPGGRAPAAAAARPAPALSTTQPQ